MTAPRNSGVYASGHLVADGMPPRSFGFVVVLGIFTALVLAATIAGMLRHEPHLRPQSFTTKDGQTIEWVGDACQVVNGSVLVCTERA